MLKIFALVCFLCGSASAQSAMTGDEFEAYTLGNTLTFIEEGQAYGIEQYLSGRRVTWAFDDGECQKGRWFEPEPTMICFVYENSDDEQHCWQFFRTDDGLRATLADTPEARELYEARMSRQPLLCLGPEVGV